MHTNIDPIDRVAMALGGALALLGIVALGIGEVLDGPPYGAAPVTNEAGELIAAPLVDPNLRTGLVLTGLLVLLLWGLYRMAQPTMAMEETRRDVVAPE